MKINIKKTRNNAKIPTKGTDGAAGFDLRVAAFIDENGNEIKSDNFLLDGFHNSMIKCGTGLAMEIPKGYCLKILPRSGMAFKENITVINSPGLIDSDYRGEIIVGLLKRESVNSKDTWIHIGNKVAQGVFEKYYEPNFRLVDELSDTERSDKGFGSTGKN